MGRRVTRPRGSGTGDEGNDVKASVEDQRRLLEVQGLDTRLRQVAHRARSLPEHADIAALAKKQSATRDRVVSARTSLSDLQRELAKAEADVTQVRDRAERDRRRLEEGGSSAKDLVGLQHELESLARRQTTLEDVELDVMERLEKAQAELDELIRTDTELEEASQQLVGSRDEQVSGLRAEHAAIAQERQKAVSDVDEKLMALYARVAEKSGGLGAAEVLEGRCGGCRLELNPVEVAALRSAAPDDVMQCEECSCILVR